MEKSEQESAEYRICIYTHIKKWIICMYISGVGVTPPLRLPPAPSSLSSFSPLCVLFLSRRRLTIRPTQKRSRVAQVAAIASVTQLQLLRSYMQQHRAMETAAAAARRGHIFKLQEDGTAEDLPTADSRRTHRSVQRRPR
jgi:hypothetical protein